MASLLIGDLAPSFADLSGVDGERRSLSSFDDKRVLVVIFTCNGCPTVKTFEHRMVAIQVGYADQGVQLVAINANNSSLSPADTYEGMVIRAKERGFNFPYLKDDAGGVAKRYGAICTPHVFLFDAQRRLRYKGRIDDSRDPSKVTSADLRNALEDVVSDSPVRVPETQAYGCSIVW